MGSTFCSRPGGWRLGSKAYGLDMTEEMVELAREIGRNAEVENAGFFKGEMEDIPPLDGHVDVVISNCVINLSTAMERTIREASRVLKAGGRFAVSDMIFLGDKSKLPAEGIRSVEMWAGCVSGALEKSKYEALLREEGFEDISVEVTHMYDAEVAAGSSCCGDAEALREVPLASAFIRARRPIGR